LKAARPRPPAGRKPEKDASMDLDLRPATTGDRERCFALLCNEAAAFLDSTLRLLGMRLAEFARRFRERGELRLILAEREEVGFLWTEAEGDALKVHAIVVSEALRGQGIGSGVLALLEAGAGPEIERIELTVHDDNDRARALYERLGFAQVERREEIGFTVLARPRRREV
jgi:ribosomal protein S18 acetylase RimI-like enzyme